MNQAIRQSMQHHDAKISETRLAHATWCTFGRAALAVCLLLTGGVMSATGSDACKQQKSTATCRDERPSSLPVMSGRLFQDYGGVNCETDMAYLDNYAVSLQNELEMRAYVVVYGGWRSTGRREVNARLSRIKRYLTAERGIGSERIITENGGFREKLTVELWLVPKGEQPPTPTPTISPKVVRFDKYKAVDDCSIFY